MQVANNGNTPLTIPAFGTSANFLIDPGTTKCSQTSPLAAGTSCQIGVYFVPLAGGTLTGTLNFIDNTLNAPGTWQQIQLSGYAVAVPPPPTFSPAPGSYAPTQQVTLSDADPAAVIYYTLDGSSPDQNANLYNGPFTISGTTTIMAIAITDGIATSAVAGGTYNTLPTADAATFWPLPGTYKAEQLVTLADDVPGSTIYYTTDGSTPTTSSPIYTVPIQVSKTTTINAMVVADGYTQSAMTSGTFTIGGVLLASGNAPLSLPATVVGAQAASQKGPRQRCADRPRPVRPAARAHGPRGRGGRRAARGLLGRQAAGRTAGRDRGGKPRRGRALAGESAAAGAARRKGDPGRARRDPAPLPRAGRARAHPALCDAGAVARRAGAAGRADPRGSARCPLAPGSSRRSDSWAAGRCRRARSPRPGSRSRRARAGRTRWPRPCAGAAPLVARVQDGEFLLDLRAVPPARDAELAAALAAELGAAR